MKCALLDTWLRLPAKAAASDLRGGCCRGPWMNASVNMDEVSGGKTLEVFGQGWVAAAIVGGQIAGTVAVAQEQPQNPASSASDKTRCERCSPYGRGEEDRFGISPSPAAGREPRHGIGSDGPVDARALSRGQRQDGSKATAAAWSDKAGFDKAAKNAQQLAEEAGCCREERRRAGNARRLRRLRQERLRRLPPDLSAKAAAIARTGGCSRR